MGAVGSRRYLAYIEESEIGVMPVTEPTGVTNHLADAQTVPQDDDVDGNESPKEAQPNKEYVATVEAEITIAEGETFTIALEGADEEMGTYAEVSVLYANSSADGALVLEAGTVLGRYRWNDEDPAWVNVVIATTDAAATGSVNVFRNAVELKRIRNTGGSGINVNRTEMQSQELRDDRQIEDMRLGNRRPELSIPFELSYEAFDDLLAAALWGDWTANVLKAGVTRHSFTIEEGFTDVDVYKEVQGALVNQFQLSIQPDSMITGTFAMVALRASDASKESVAPSAVVDVATNAPYDSFTGELKIAGEVVADIAGINLNLQNGAEAKFAVLGGQNAYRMLEGRSNLTLEINADFKDSTHYDRFLNETEVAIEFEIVDTEGNKYAYSLPRVKYTGNNPTVTENDVTQQLSAIALRDSGIESQIQITRTDG